MKKILSLIILTFMLLGACVTAYAGGLPSLKIINSYDDGQFKDVPSTSWCAQNVKAVYEYGLMTGKSGTYFDTEGDLTLAEVIAMACRLHNLYNEKNAEFEQATPWYTPYVEYALKNGIISTEFSDYNVKVNRAEFASILGASLPDDALPVCSSIEAGSIPDIPEGAGYSDAVYRLYNAGILVGNDKKGTFTPDSNITRGAAAAIIGRMADPLQRKVITLVKAPFEPVPIDQLANIKSIKKKLTDAEFKQAYDAASIIVAPLAKMSREDQLAGIAAALRDILDNGQLSYSTSSPHYSDPYGYLIEGSASCAGCTRTTGLCLNMLGIPYEHVNENQWSHQWCRVNIDGTYWICDAFGLYCGPEPAPYTHPYLN